MTNRLTISISESIGSVSVIEVVPDKFRALLVLAHGAGAGMEHVFMEKLAVELADLGIATIRYNFPYMENGKGRPDVPAVAEKTVAQVCEWAYQKFKRTPIFIGGKSFGGRMSSQRISKECPAYIQGIIFYGFPLHGIGKESTDRADHLKQINIPMLFLQGTKDKLARLDLIKKVCKKLPKATLVELEGADHSFKVPKKINPPNLPALTVGWLDPLLSK
jgi:predicted alpha/beta-hydrolase family hydrolase